MKTVDKALQLLDQFSLTHTEVGLSELARMAELDKAATRRLLVALSKHGFIEQSAETRKYRLGQGFLRLARIREATVPITKVAQEVVDWLAGQLGETVHVSVPGTTGMTTIAYRLPNRARVITINPAETLFFHATASGLVYTAFAPLEKREAIMAIKREKVTVATVTKKGELLRLTKEFRAQGYARVAGAFEDDVASIAMPFFKQADDPAGAISIAFPIAELTDARRDEALPLLREAVKRIEQATGGAAS